MIEGATSWSDDYAAARIAARRRHRLVLMQFCVEERPLCGRVRQETETDPALTRAIAGRFLGVWMDARREAALFQRLTGEHGAMATCIVDADEDVVTLWSGFADGDVYRDLLDRAWAGFPALVRARRLALRDPDDLASAFRLAEAYGGLDSPRRARQTYERVVELAVSCPARSAPVAAAAHERLARLDVARGRNLEARGHLETAARLDRTRRLVPLDRLALSEALILFTERRLVEARDRLVGLLQGWPESSERPQALFTLGLLQHELRDDAGALATLAEVRDGAAPARWRSAAVQQIAHINDPAVHRH